MTAFPTQSAPWHLWRERRPAFHGLHFDSAAAGRSSTAVLEAVSAHALAEAVTGASVAYAAATPAIEQGRSRLGSLLGIAPDGIAFVESATAALETLLDVWPLHPGDTVAVARTQWGPALPPYAARGLRTVELACDAVGRVDLERLDQLLQQHEPPTVLALTQLAAHTGVEQPARQVRAICEAHGVALWVDAAQSLGHVDTAVSADAVWATSRKWLAGPRGVGVLAVAAPWWDKLRVRPPVLAPDELSPMRMLDFAEAHIAGRVGLCAALGEYLADGPAAIAARLAAIGALTRLVLGDLPGWEVVAGSDSAISALRPTRGQEPSVVRAALLDRHQILTTASQQARSPLDPVGPTLRISPHVDCTDDDLMRLRDALASL